MVEKTMDKIVALAKSRGFVYPGSEIYGGLANTWDYGNCWILPASAVCLQVFIPCQELDILRVTLTFRVLFCTAHMMSMKRDPVIIVGFAFFKDILLLLRRPIPCSFSFLNEVCFQLPRIKNSLVRIFSSFRHRTTLLSRECHWGGQSGKR